MNSACSFFMNMKKTLLDPGSKINENSRLKKKSKDEKFFVNEFLKL